MHPYTRALVDALPKNGFKLTEGVQPLEEVPGCPYYENCPIRLDKCQNNKPELENHDGIMIRCFNIDGAAEEAVDVEESVDEVSDELVSEDASDVKESVDEELPAENEDVESEESNIIEEANDGA